MIFGKTNTVRIGTRDSVLAMWQAKYVSRLLNNIGILTEIIPVKSEGDLDLKTPIYKMGIQGVFTKTLDAAILNRKINIAVHSMKDVPVTLAQGLTQYAVLPRHNAADVFVSNTDGLDFNKEYITIGTGSLRRKAQWLHRFPHHTVENLRGNLQTRISKLKSSNWSGAIFAKAGLERIGMDVTSSTLDWMIPAPAQGAIVIVGHEDDNETYKRINVVNDLYASICTKIERDFLHQLEGGCSAPIGARATILNNDISFTGCVTSLNGTEHIEIRKTFKKDDLNAGIRLADEIIANGAKDILDKIKSEQR